MMIRTASLAVIPEPSIVIQAVDRSGIRIPFVEVLDFPCLLHDRRAGRSMPKSSTKLNDLVEPFADLHKQSFG